MDLSFKCKIISTCRGGGGGSTGFAGCSGCFAGGCAWAPHIKVFTQQVEFSTARGVTC